MEEGEPLNQNIQNQEITGQSGSTERHSRQELYDLSDAQSQNSNMKLFSTGNIQSNQQMDINIGIMENPIMPQGNQNIYQNPMSGRIMDARQRLQMQNNKMVCQRCLTCYGNFCNVLCFCSNMMCKNNVVIIPTGTAGIQLKYGKFHKILPSGTYYINGCTDEIRLVDTKTQIQDINNVFLLTREQISVTINAYVAFRIVDPFQSTFGIQNLKTCISDVTSSILKSLVGKNTLSDILRKQSEVAQILRSQLEKYLRPSGIIISNAELTSFSVGSDMQNRLAIAAVAKRDYESRKLISESEVQCAKMYNKAAALMNKNKGTLELTYFETLKEISEHDTHTVIMPSKMIFLHHKKNQKDGNKK